MANDCKNWQSAMDMNINFYCSGKPIPTSLPYTSGCTPTDGAGTAAKTTGSGPAQTGKTTSSNTSSGNSGRAETIDLGLTAVAAVGLGALAVLL